MTTTTGVTASVQTHLTVLDEVSSATATAIEHVGFFEQVIVWFLGLF